MPPRKRTQSTPTSEESGEQMETAVEAEAGSRDETSDAPAAVDEPERGDLQGGEPCSECFPGGWAAKDDSVGALGCEHGTWQRDPVS